LAAKTDAHPVSPEPSTVSDTPTVVSGSAKPKAWTTPAKTWYGKLSSLLSSLVYMS